MPFVQRWPRICLALFGIGSLAAVALPGAAAAEGSQGPRLPAPLLVPCGSGLLGDVTGDDEVDDDDARQIFRWSLGLSVSATVASRIPTHGDVTGDGDVNAVDAQQVLRWSVGLSVPFPIDEDLPSCQGIRVTTTTTGVTFDPDGYAVFLDGGFQSNVGVNSAVDLSNATPAGHTVLLQGLASNCGVTNGSASRSVTLVEGQPSSVHYEVECMATGLGTIQVRNVTTCSSPPGTPYTVTLDGSMAQSMGVGGMVEFNGVPFGTHQVALGNVPPACAVVGGAAKSVSISSGFTLLDYAIGNAP